MEKYFFTFEVPKGSPVKNSQTVGIFLVFMAIVGGLAICGSLVV